MINGLTGCLGDEKRLELEAALWALCAREAELYTAGDSSSLPAGTAQELLRSVSFTLDISGIAPTPESLTGALALGRKKLGAMVLRGKALWSRACLTAPGAENEFYRRTLKSIGGFFRLYDLRFFAREAPCEVDYQLCRPVPETLLGIAYINEYLRRIIAENVIMGHFPPRRIQALLGAWLPDYSSLPANLCEPVILSACGLIIAGREADTLTFTAGVYDSLSARLSGLSGDELRPLLSSAAEALCRDAGLSGEGSDYIVSAALDALPRLSAALAAGDISAVFPSA